MARIVIPQTIWSGLGLGAVTAKTKDSCRLDRLVRVDGALKIPLKSIFAVPTILPRMERFTRTTLTARTKIENPLEFFGPGGPRKAVLVRAPTCVNRPYGSKTPSMSEPRVLWLRLSERVSSKGTTYLTGWSGGARVVGFRSKEPDKFGNPVWDLFLQPRQERPPAHNAARGHQDLSALSERADAWSAKQREEYSQEWAAKFDQRGPDDEPF